MLKLINKATSKAESITTKDFITSLKNVDVVNREIIIKDKTYHYDSVEFIGDNPFVYLGKITNEMLTSIPDGETSHSFAFQNVIPAGYYINDLIIYMENKIDIDYDQNPDEVNSNPSISVGVDAAAKYIALLTKDFKSLSFVKDCSKDSISIDMENPITLDIHIYLNPEQIEVQHLNLNNLHGSMAVFARFGDLNSFGAAILELGVGNH